MSSRVQSLCRSVLGEDVSVRDEVVFDFCMLFVIQETADADTNMLFRKGRETQDLVRGRCRQLT